MDRQNPGQRTQRFTKWFRRRHKRADPSHLNEISYAGEEEEEDDDDDDGDDHDHDVMSMEMDPCISTNELRVFVGTWNVAGRSPEGSLAVDLDEWLNLKDAADMYVLGFQEIVPLKPRAVIGSEDPTEATNWNLLIGKTLNNKYGCPWLTPMFNQNISSDNYLFDTEFETTRSSVSSRVKTPKRDWSRTQSERLYWGSKYKLLASKKMVGVFISVWIRRELLRKYCISNVKVCSVACGIMGYLGNKGSVSVCMSIERTSFCFIAAHLASGEKKGDEGRRNHQVSEIFKRTTFPRSPNADDNHRPLTILGHDQISWFGDLNYRLYLEDALARELIKKQDWRGLQEFDQLRREQEEGGVFQGWKEGNIEFPPTYKYCSSNGNRYSGGAPIRSGEKPRTPAWCDRILWYGKGVKQLSYFRSESKFSDHRPVSALFSTQVEVTKSTNPRGVAMQTILPADIKPPNDTDLAKTNEEAKSTLLSLMAKDIELSPTHVKNL